MSVSARAVLVPNLRETSAVVSKSISWGTAALTMAELESRTSAWTLANQRTTVVRIVTVRMERHCPALSVDMATVRTVELLAQLFVDSMTMFRGHHLVQPSLSCCL